MIHIFGLECFSLRSIIKIFFPLTKVKTALLHQTLLNSIRLRPQSESSFFPWLWNTRQTSWNKREALWIVMKHSNTRCLMCRYWCSMRQHHCSVRQYRCSALSFRRYIGDCGVGIIPQMCNRVTNPWDMGIFSRPGLVPLLNDWFSNN